MVLERNTWLVCSNALGQACNRELGQACSTELVQVGNMALVQVCSKRARDWHMLGLLRSKLAYTSNDNPKSQLELVRHLPMQTNTQLLTKLFDSYFYSPIVKIGKKA